MKEQITKRQIGSLAALFYVARKAADILSPEKEMDDKQVDTIVTNKVLSQAQRIEEEGGSK